MGAGLHQDPAIVVYRREKLHKFSVWIVTHIELPHVDGISKPSAQRIEALLEVRRQEIFRVGVPADLHGRLGHLIKDRLHDRDILSQMPMHFHADQLSIILRKPSHLIKRGGDLCDGLLSGNSLWQRIRLYLESGCADIMAELDVFLGAFDVFFEFGGIRAVVLIVTPIAEASDCATRKASLYLHTLGRGEVGLDRVRMLSAKFYSQHSGLFAVGDQRG